MRSSHTHLVSVDPQIDDRGCAGFAFVDGLGMRIGRISGWVLFEERPIFLRIVLSNAEELHYLVSVSYVTHVDAARRTIHVSELTRATVGCCCPAIGDDLSTVEGLRDQMRVFPAVDPEVEERLAVLTASAREL